MLKSVVYNKFVNLFQTSGSSCASTRRVAANLQRHKDHKEGERSSEEETACQPTCPYLPAAN